MREVLNFFFFPAKNASKWKFFFFCHFGVIVGFRFWFVFFFFVSKQTKKQNKMFHLESALLFSKVAFLIERCRKRDILDEAMVREAGGRSVLHENVLLSFGTMMLLCF